jgi:hypothetical protein
MGNGEWEYTITHDLKEGEIFMRLKTDPGILQAVSETGRA